MPKGNMGKWFKSRKTLKKHVDKVMNEYNRQYEYDEITWEEYVRRCPYARVCLNSSENDIVSLPTNINYYTIS